MQLIRARACTDLRLPGDTQFEGTARRDDDHCAAGCQAAAQPCASAAIPHGAFKLRTPGAATSCAAHRRLRQGLYVGPATGKHAVWQRCSAACQRWPSNQPVLCVAQEQALRPFVAVLRLANSLAVQQQVVQAVAAALTAHTCGLGSGARSMSTPDAADQRGRRASLHVGTLNANTGSVGGDAGTTATMARGVHADWLSLWPLRQEAGTIVVAAQSPCTETSYHGVDPDCRVARCAGGADGCPR